MKSFCFFNSCENATWAALSSSTASPTIFSYLAVTKGLALFVMMLIPLIGGFASRSLADVPDTTSVHQLEGIVVVANSENTPVREVGSSVTVITAEEIERSQQQSVTEILRNVPGLDVVQTGARGGLTSVCMRGSNSGHTLVIVDGIEMNDPSSPNGAFDFADLSVDNIERIEVLRGSQSILYGSEAIGGVISIITRTGAGARKTTLSANYGAFSTSKVSAVTSGSTARVSYSLSASRTDSKGFSATESLVSNERDDYGLTSLSGKLVVRPSDYSQVKLTVRSSDSKTDLDKGFSSFTNFGVFDDLNNLQSSRKIFLKAEADISDSSQVWRGKVSASFASTDRTATDSTDAAFGAGFQDSKYDSETLHFGLKGILTPIDNQRLIVGVETERESLSQNTDFGFGASSLSNIHAITTGVYALAQLSASDKLFVTLGVRNDDHERFGNHASARATATLAPRGFGTRIKASFGGGFNAPTLFQLFDPLYGDPTLQPEESESWDIGIEQRLFAGRANMGVTWFHQSINNIFGFDPATFRTINIASALSEGVEVFADVKLNQFFARLDYTYTDAIDKVDGSSLLRRAKNKIVFRATYTPNKLTSASVRVRHIGARFDNDFEMFPAQRVTLGSYTVVGLTAQRKVFEGLTVTGRIENLFDKQYQDVWYYATSDRAVYFGVRYSL